MKNSIENTQRNVYITMSASLLILIIATVAIFIGTHKDELNKGEVVSDKVILEIKDIQPNSQKNDFSEGFYIEGDNIIWSSAGSSSCPPIIEEAVYDEDSNEVTLIRKDYKNKPCTMDLRSVAQSIDITGLPKNIIVKVNNR